MMNEAEVIQAIVNGADRYHELIERYHAGLIIHCERIVKDRDDAEDVAQEAFIKAYLNLKDYDPDKARFSTWLYRIATNQAINHLQKSRRKIIVDEIDSIAEATMPTHLEDERKQEILAAVLKLVPPEYRQAVEAYYWQGLSYQEIAEQLDVPLNTLRTWLSRAKKQLREELA